MENPPIFKNGQPSISMGHGFHGEVLVITFHGYVKWPEGTYIYGLKEP
jgi:hypothetical protein